MSHVQPSSALNLSHLIGVCVYCGSNHGARPEYTQTAQSLGRLIAEAGTALVYGGGNVGLMGVAADAVLNAGGRVIGVIPQSLLDREVAHLNVTELKVVQTMHERKALMETLSDAFIAMPGGFGTLDELFEILTWSQLGIHDKPIGL
ncbi:MAG: TIGR00730 family Rossman fold protein, partial [Bdellovibrionaceae bacterium]|nr:TIGR00730 family Rossman fold protein [Pseudobdellovibrionaceae bacterium]